jgi:hypothetical protein
VSLFVDLSFKTDTVSLARPQPSPHDAANHP